MAAHRYWRAVAMEAYGAGDLELSCFHLLYAGARVDALAALTASAAPATGAVADLQDSDLTTAARWPVQSVAGLALTWDFGSAVSVNDLRLAGDSEYRFLFAAKLQYSDAGAVWTDFCVFSGLTYPGKATLTASVPASAADASFADVVLQLRTVGAGAQFVVDECGNPVTAYGCHATIKAGRPSAIYVPPGVAGLSIPIPTADHPLNLTTGDFTIETWVCLEWSDAAGYGLFDWGGGYNYSWPSIRLHLDGVVGLTVGLRSNATEGAPDIANFVIVNGVVPGVGQWFHVALTRQGSIFRLWVNGVQKYQVSSSLPLHSSAGTLSGVNVGCTGPDAGNLPVPSYAARAAYHGFRVTKSCRYSATFTPQVLPNPGIPTNALPGRTASTDPISVGTGPTTIYGIPALVESAHLTVQSGAVKDYTTGVLGTGRGRVSGTVKEKGTPDAPVYRKVRLIREVDGLLMRELWSHPVTGAYSFDYIDELQKYTVLSYDHTGAFRAVVASGITPELIP